MGAAKTTGKTQAARTATAQARTPNLANFYRYKLPPIMPGEFTFLLELLRPGLAPLSLDRMVDSLNWDDEQSILSGSLTAYRPDPENPATLPVTRGMNVRCRVRWAGGTYELWTMRAQAPLIEVETGQITVQLQDDMALLDGAARDWWFRKTKHRPFGYTADEVARQVAQTLGVKVRAVVKGRHRFELKMPNATGLAVIQAAYAKEKVGSGSAFVVRLRNGQLEVVTLQRNPAVYVLGDQIRTAALQQAAGAKVPTTILTGRGRVGAGAATKSVSYTAMDRRIVGAYGAVRDTHDFGRVTSMADLRDQTNRELAKRLQLNDTITIEHQGIPFILRGDGVELNLPLEGYKGANRFVYCTRATHSVQAATYTTTWDFTLVDPYHGQLAGFAKQSGGKSAKQRAAKRTQRNRTKLK